jgi:hypothetical protein
LLQKPVVLTNRLKSISARMPDDWFEKELGLLVQPRYYHDNYSY